MINHRQEELLRKILTESSPVLFLGAGFSIGAKNDSGLLDGKGLKELICDSLISPKVSPDELKEIRDYDLREVCDQVYYLYKGKSELYDLLIKCFKNTTVPDDDYHMKITAYPWKVIYTVNIDDLLEYIYTTQHKSFHVQNKSKLKNEPSKEHTEIYKLHGCVNIPENGFVFSNTEYTGLTSYTNCNAQFFKLSEDILNQNIIFLGASLDEPDIDHYLHMFNNAGAKHRTNKLVFINPNPDMKLKRRIDEMNGELIESNTEEFLTLVQSINYNPQELEKEIYKMNYEGIYRLSDLENNMYVSPYESKIFTGQCCEWQDAADNWIIKTTAYNNAIVELDELINAHNPVSCFSIYGAMFSGKSCILKCIGYYLFANGYEVLDFQGVRLNFKTLKSYFELSASNRIAIIIDKAAYFYKQIEQFFFEPIKNKEVLIVTASRTYYHKRKKYFLEGNPYKECEITADFTAEDIDFVLQKLKEKSFLADLSSRSNKEQKETIAKSRNMVNLILRLTYGNVASRIKTAYEQCIKTLPFDNMKLVLELAVFDALDIEIYPIELYVERYGSLDKLANSIDNDNIGIADLIRVDRNGLSLRNSLLSKLILQAGKNDIVSSIQDMLKCISKRIVENQSDAWNLIFQGLLAQKRLVIELKLSKEEIRDIFLEVKEEYKDISYYWLQLGLLYQRNKEYSMAFNYLKMSSSIRPEAYQIQHAIARNHLKYANDLDNSVIAKEQFEEGEKLMKKLIDSDKKNIRKAIPFSVTAYVSEKIKYLEKNHIEPSNNELRYMSDAIKKASDMNDDYMNAATKRFIRYLKQINKLSILSFPIDSAFLSNAISDLNDSYEEDEDTYDYDV